MDAPALEMSLSPMDSLGPVLSRTPGPGPHLSPISSEPRETKFLIKLQTPLLNIMQH